MSPAVHHAQQEKWKFFCTLTFAGRVPSPAYALALQSRWLERSSTVLLHETPESLLWLSREELGETNGRLHSHVLLGELQDASRVNRKTCLALMGMWEKVTEKALGLPGMARVRVFEPDLQGAQYVLKGLEGVTEWTLRGANSYELGKFGAEVGRTVRLARSLVLRWQGEKGLKYVQQARARRDAQRVKCEL